MLAAVSRAQRMPPPLAAAAAAAARRMLQVAGVAAARVCQKKQTYRMRQDIYKSGVSVCKRAKPVKEPPLNIMNYYPHVLLVIILITTFFIISFL
jgi:hypothetical protein